jgi:microcompartment protein CcmK/EutM
MLRSIPAGKPLKGASKMILGKITGQVISTQKDPGLNGYKLLIVQDVSVEAMGLKSSYVVAVDTVGAGMGELVIVVTGSSARLAEGAKDRPVDSAIVGIVDSIQIGGELRYSKRERADAAR